MKHICTYVVLKLGQPVDTLSVVGSSSVTGAGGRVLDAEAVIVNINNRIRTGGDVDWVMPLYSALLLGSHITIVYCILFFLKTITFQKRRAPRKL